MQPQAKMLIVGSINQKEKNSKYMIFYSRVIYDYLKESIYY